MGHKPMKMCCSTFKLEASKLVSSTQMQLFSLLFRTIEVEGTSESISSQLTPFLKATGTFHSCVASPTPRLSSFQSCTLLTANNSSTICGTYYVPETYSKSFTGVALLNPIATPVMQVCITVAIFRWGIRYPAWMSNLLNSKTDKRAELPTLNPHTLLHLRSVLIPHDRPSASFTPGTYLWKRMATWCFL